MPETPEIAAAVAKQGQMENEAKQRAAALRSQNLLGGAHLYNMGMGDKTPIADWLGKKFGSTPPPTDPATTMATPTMGAESTAVLPGTVDTGAALAEMDMMLADPLLTGATGGAEAAAATTAATPAAAGAGGAAATGAGGAAAAGGLPAFINPITGGLAAAYLLTQTDLGEDITDGLSDALRFIDPFELFS